MSNFIKLRAYPKEIVQEFIETQKSLIRTNTEQSCQGGSKRLLAADNTNPCFLAEAGYVKCGQEYSFFEINKLGYDIQQSLFSLVADISFPNECIEISLCADLLATDTNAVISSFELKKASNQKSLNYDVEERIAVNTRADKFAVIVYADWKPSRNSTNSAAVLSYIFKDISFKCNHLYPKKEEKYIRFPQNPMNIIQSPPNILALLSDSTRAEYIQIALFRMPDDHKDLDYLCEFGKDSAGQPYMCVPTVFDLILHSGNTEFCEDAKAICTISSLDPNSGGKYIVASGSTDITESEVTIKVKPKTIHVEMLKPWKVSFPYGRFLHPYDFSYEVAIELSTKTDGRIMPPQTIYAISSIKDKSACLVKIPHISIRWGCLDENTLIKMADWSMKQIKNIHIGDIIACKDGNRQVVNVWRGREDKYVSITTDIQANFSQLHTTTDHPILTVNGYKCAQDISVGDILLGERSEVRVTGVTLEEREINVYNLSFNDGRTQVILANGIYVGDFDCQNNFR